jgi:hypothetical protein
MLEEDPSQVVTHLLLRDVLRIPKSDQQVKLAYEGILNNAIVTTLEDEQWDDGSWGRLHSQDTQSSQTIPTTEWAVERAIRLGIEASHPMFQRVSDHLISILETGICHDRAEKNDRWDTGVRLFAGSTLSWIQPDHPAIDDTFELWLKILRATFRAETYDPDEEIRAHQSLTGANIKGSYLRLNNKYAVKLLGSRSGRVPEHLQIAYLKWLSSNSEGLIYLQQALHPPPTFDRPRPIERWLTSMEVLSDFTIFSSVFADPVMWIWDKRCDDGYWDLGLRLRNNPALPFSGSWRKSLARKHDWTTRILLFLRTAINY